MTSAAQFDGSLGSVRATTLPGPPWGTCSPVIRQAILFGAGAMYQGIGSNDIFRIGPEVELYLDQFSFEAFGGFEDADNGGNDFFFVGDVAFYPDDNLRISAGYSRALGIDAAQFGLEWMPNLDFGMPLSVFAQAQVGEGNFESFWAGIRFYFSDDPGKSLIRRHREDDPQFKGQQLEREGEDNVQPPIVDTVIKDLRRHCELSHRHATEVYWIGESSLRQSRVTDANFPPALGPRTGTVRTDTCIVPPSKLSR